MTGQEAYEANRNAKPHYHDGTPRPAWELLSHVTQSSWERPLRCDMDYECIGQVTHIDEKGFAYCEPHGIERKAYRRCRKLKPAELKLLLSGLPIPRY